MNATITPYLFYGGRCEEALEFYRKALGAEVERKMLYSESPDPVPPGMLAPGFENKVMHSSILVRGARVMLSDGRDEKSTPDGFQLSMTVPTEADAHRAFDALADGGQVIMPISKTFWSPCFGMVTDRFNVTWMITIPEADPS